MSRFEITDHDGDTFTASATVLRDGTPVLAICITEYDDSGPYVSAVAHLPLARLEEVIAGMRSTARSTGREPDTVTVGLTFPEGDELAGTVRAAVRPGSAVPAPRATDMPSADYHSAWTELTGYVQEAVNDGGTITPADLLAYMQELRRNALAPAREWMRRITDGEPTP